MLLKLSSSFLSGFRSSGCDALQPHDPHEPGGSQDVFRTAAKAHKHQGQKRPGLALFQWHGRARVWSPQTLHRGTHASLVVVVRCDHACQTTNSEQTPASGLRMNKKQTNKHFRSYQPTRPYKLYCHYHETITIILNVILEGTEPSKVVLESLFPGHFSVALSLPPSLYPCTTLALCAVFPFDLSIMSFT